MTTTQKLLSFFPLLTWYSSASQSPSQQFDLVFNSASARQEILKLYDEKLLSLTYSFSEIDVETSRGNTHVVVMGDTANKPVVLLHGINSGAPITLEIFQELSKNFCIYAVDIIGQPNKSSETRLSMNDSGYSDWLLECIEKLNLQKPDVIGVSYGAFFLQTMMKYHPEKINKCIFVVPAGFTLGSPFKSIFKLLIPMKNYQSSGEEADLLEFMDAFYTEKDPYSVRYQKASIAGINFDLRQIPLVKKKDFQSFTSPVFLMVAENDVLFSPNKTQRAAKKNIPTLSETYLLKNSKHIPPARQYGEIVGVVGKWLNK